MRGADVLLSFGGIYGNLHALRALASAESEADSATTVCAGDLAAYCADGAAVCEMMRRRFAAATIVRGNCERAIAADEDECGCGFAPGSACERLSAGWYPHAKRSIPAADRKWMGALPPRVFRQFGGRKIAVLHAAADSDNRFIFASSPAAEKRAIMDELRADAVIAGHSGIPFTQNIGGKIWHNSGALGMPANDGTPRVWYAKWIREAGGVRITHRFLEYDFAAAQKAMADAGLSAEYRIALQTGIWPSDEVLPPAERAMQGRAIEPQTYFWPDAA
ncbi:MAG: metallophosphoesterase family protein [Gammaproteobacteria bacterium]